MSSPSFNFLLILLNCRPSVRLLVVYLFVKLCYCIFFCLSASLFPFPFHFLRSYGQFVFVLTEKNTVWNSSSVANVKQKNWLLLIEVSYFCFCNTIFRLCEETFFILYTLRTCCASMKKSWSFRRITGGFFLRFP